MANGKRKGNNYERIISRQLSLWISDGEYDDLFWRTQGSGGRHSIRLKKNLTLEGQAGDISSTRSGVSEDFIKVFCVEIKFYKDINIWGFVTKSKSGVLDFWEQTCNKAKQVNKIPILIAKENYKPTLFISDVVLNRILVKKFKLKSELDINLQSQKIFIWKLDDILEIDPKKFMSIIYKVGELNGKKVN